MNSTAGRLLMLTIVTVAMAGVTGCRALGPPPDEFGRCYTLDRKGGYWEIAMDGTVADFHIATMRALKVLHLEPITSRRGKVSAMVNALFADQEYLEVEMESIDFYCTRLRIRCGFMEDEERTSIVFRTIVAHLPCRTGDPRDVKHVRFKKPIFPLE